MEFDEKLMKRIWLHIDKTESCWISKYESRDVGGHSRIRINNKMCQFHRIMLFWSNQSKTIEFADYKNFYACHNCRNPHCVNPQHLYWGTPDSNSKDKIRDGTTNNGEKSNTCKLTNQQVLDIRAKYSTKKSSHSKDITYESLAQEYNIGKSAIERIISRKSWSHLL